MRICLTYIWDRVEDQTVHHFKTTWSSKLPSNLVFGWVCADINLSDVPTKVGFITLFFCGMPDPRFFVFCFHRVKFRDSSVRCNWKHRKGGCMIRSLTPPPLVSPFAYFTSPWFKYHILAMKCKLNKPWVTILSVWLARCRLHVPFPWLVVFHIGCFAQNIFSWEREKPPCLWKDYICPTLSPPPPVEVLWCSYI